MKIVNAVAYGFLGLGMLVSLACSDVPSEPVKPQAEQVVKSENPFPFYKSIEIKAGLYFEVLSWGKGVDSVGGYLILMSDSLKNNYRSISVERKGMITDAWNMDLDNDGNPEIYVQSTSKDNRNDLNVYEFNSNSFDKISFPRVNANLKAGFKGNDKFFVKNGDLYRSVPVEVADSGKVSTLVKTFNYRLSGNSFSSKEVKPE